MSVETPERKVKNQINKEIKRLRNSGIKIYSESRIVGGFNYKKGTPDLWISLNGKHIEIEVKRESGGKLSTEQIQWQQYFKDLAVPCYAVSSLDEFKKIIDKELAN